MRKSILFLLPLLSMCLLSCAEVKTVNIDYFIEFETADISQGSVSFVLNDGKAPSYLPQADSCRMLVWEGEDAKEVYACPKEGYRFLQWTKRIIRLSRDGWSETASSFPEERSPNIQIKRIYENAIYTAFFAEETA